MKEASSSPFFSPRTQNAGAAAAGFPAERQTPAVLLKSFCCSASLFSSPSSSVNSSNSSSSVYSSHLGYPMIPASPFCSSSAVPFSWEKKPGVPKHSHHAKEHQRRPDQTLPPPPSLRSNSDPFLSVPRTKKRPQLRFLADPFALALMECSKEDRRDPAEDEDAPALYWKRSTVASKVVGGRRRTIADRFGLIDLYTSSCKTTCSVADSTVYIPRSGRGMAAYDLLSRRAG